MTLKTAVIGYGVVGKNHAACHSMSERASLEWICDLNPERADAGAADFGAKAVNEVETLLRDHPVDAVSVCLPPVEHCAVFLRCVEAGVHTLCEKPLGISFERLDAMTAAAASTEVVTAGIFQHRFSPLVRAIRNGFQAGELGEIRGGQMRFYCNRDRAYYEADAWRGKWTTEGGGLCINQAIHSLDLLHFIFGSPQSISGRIERRRVDLPTEVEDYAVGTLRFGEGIEVGFEMENAERHTWFSEIELIGSSGTLRFNGAADHQVTSLEGGSDAFRESLARAKEEEAAVHAIVLPAKADYGTEHSLQIEDFFTAIENGGKPFVSIADSAQTNRTVLSLYRSSAENGAVVALG